MEVLIGIGAYFALGIVALGLLDLFTKRIRNRLLRSVDEAKNRLAEHGTYIGSKESTIITIGVLWLFWPLAILSAAQRSKNG